jgi:transcriptional regulator of acetoin/glycerol metabolism
MVGAPAEGSTLARAALRRHGVVPTGLLAVDIYDSWLRCVALGLDCDRPPNPEYVSVGELRAEQERRSFVRGLALAEMQVLHQQIAGTNFLIAFATPEGLLLDIVADESFKDGPDGKAIRPGVWWDERRCGTNGIGIAAFLKRPAVVHGDDHFYSCFRSLTCCAAPVFDPDGSLAGVLDASSDCASRQSHTRVLVEMSATQIENGLFRERHWRDIVVAFHNRSEFLHTLSVGLLALDESGSILAANQAERELARFARRRGNRSARSSERAFRTSSARAGAQSASAFRMSSAAPMSRASSRRRFRRCCAPCRYRGRPPDGRTRPSSSPLIRQSRPSFARRRRPRAAKCRF